MDELQMIFSSDWQDCYRIMDGYLFVVNKFVEVDDMRTTYTIPKNYYRRVDQKAKGKLWILTRPVKRYGGYKNYELLEPNEENPNDGVVRIYGFVVVVTDGAKYVGQKKWIEIDNAFKTHCFAHIIEK